MYIDLVGDFLYQNITFEMFLIFVGVFFIIIWFAILVWVVKDIANRTESIGLQIFSVLLMLCVPFLGLLMYLFIRPSKTLLEKYHQEIDYNLDLVGLSVEAYIKRKYSENK